MANVITENISLKQSLVNQVWSWFITSPGGGLYVQTLLILLLILLISNSRSYRRGLLIVNLGLSIIPALLVEQRLTFTLHGMDVLDSHIFLWDGLYFLFGLLLGESEKTKMISLRKVLLIYVITIVAKVAMSITGISLFSRIVNMLIAGSLFLLLYAGSAPYNPEKSLQFRQWSAIIYFTHMTVKYGVQMVFKVCHIAESTMVFAVSAIILFLYAVMIYRYFRGKRFYKLLYS